MARKKKQRNLRRRNAITGYLFIAPFIIGFLFFLLKPMIESFRMSLSEVVIAASQQEGGKGFIMEPIKTWKDSNYYRAFFYDPYFKTRLTDSLKEMAIQVPAIIVFSFFIALILNQEFIISVSWKAMVDLRLLFVTKWEKSWNVNIFG